MKDSAQEVRRRRVFYMPGFDPHPDRRYHRLFREEGARQARISGYRLEVGRAVQGDHRADWSAVYADDSGAKVETDLRVWSWRDLVSARMKQPLWRRALRGYGAYGRLIFSGDVFRLGRLAWTPMIPMLYPLAAVTFYFLLSLGAGAAVLALMVQALGSVGWILGLASGALAARAVFRLLRRRDGRIFAFYLFDAYALMQDHASGAAPELEARLDGFVEDLAAASKSGVYDEILVIGHSLGAAFAAEICGRAFARDPDLAARGARIGVLTLGQILSAFSAVGGGRGAEVRRASRSLAARPDAVWVDVTSQADGACFALVDPLAGDEAPPSAERRAGPKLVSGRFRETMGEAEYARLRRKWNRLHFQYLHAFERPGVFEYFAICAGPLSLATRFAGLRSSRHAPPLAAEAEGAASAPDLAAAPA
ncbi:hypothetical protein [Neomegalonema sp.]|uniref:hypothetical protein n=1 Tax=Neomegalonema sp. TaxID=2039713 RepID=UPI002623C70C|nr:hypothetical protein [Neomegalonema sp.]MDD2867072.1 hypothetical protein [Neomegalonema sp.]